MRSIHLVLQSHPLAGLAVVPLLKNPSFSIARVSGCGHSALPAALVAMGCHNDIVEKIVQDYMQRSFYQRLKPLSISRFFKIDAENYTFHQSLFSPKSKKKYLEAIFENRTMDSLLYPLTLIATDLYTAEPLSLEEGLLSDAVYASSAWYPFHPPAHLQGRLLISGEFSESLPLSNLEEDQLTVVVQVDDPFFYACTGHVAQITAFFDRTYRNIDQSIKSKLTHDSENIITIQIKMTQPLCREKITLSEVQEIYKQVENQILNAYPLEATGSE